MHAGASLPASRVAGALAVTPLPPPLEILGGVPGLRRLLHASSRRATRTSSSWAIDQAPLAALMDAHCNAHPELALPSSPQNNTSAEKWTVGALPYALSSSAAAPAFRCYLEMYRAAYGPHARLASEEIFERSARR